MSSSFSEAMHRFFSETMSGWLDLTTNGKIFALLLIGLVLYFLFLSEKYVQRITQIGSKSDLHHTLVVYAGFASGLLLLPPTFGLLYKLQPAFFHGIWLLSIVPVIPVLGVIITQLVEYLFVGAIDGGKSAPDNDNPNSDKSIPDNDNPNSDKSEESQESDNIASCKKSTKKYFIPIGTCVLLILAILLCGNLGSDNWKKDTLPDNGEKLETILQTLPEDAVIVGSSDLMEYARTSEPAVKTLYGRDLWMAYAAAYTFDQYPEVYSDIYRWMSDSYAFGYICCNGRSTADCLKLCVSAIESGANTLFLPSPDEALRMSGSDVAKASEDLERLVLDLSLLYELTYSPVLVDGADSGYVVICINP